MSIVDFLSDLRRAGINISLNEDKLKIKAPSGALTNDIKLELKKRKEEIIEFLKQALKSSEPEIPLVDRTQSLPLSFNQQGLWFIDQVNPGSAAYNMPIALLLKGNLDLAAFKKALSEITRRHEVLRSRFLKMEDGSAHVVIDAPKPFDLDVDNQQAISLEDKAAIAALVTKDAMAPFDLALGPLFRVKLIKLESNSGDAHLLLGGMHHIISDGWSQTILMQELGVLYASYEKGQQSPLPDLPIQFVDYANWQRQFLTGENLEKQLKYWRDELSGVSNVLSLPTDNPRPAIQTTHGAYYKTEFKKANIDGINALCKEKGITLFTGLMAAWQLTLSRYSQQNKFCVGIPMLGRSQKETEGLIGFFINALLIKADTKGNPSIAEFIERVKNTVLGAFEHQHVPLQLILDDQDVPRSMAHQPMAQVGFQLQDFSQGSQRNTAVNTEQMVSIADLQMEALASDEVVAKYDMILSLSQYDKKMVVEVEYNRDLFQQDTIARMINHFEIATAFMISDENKPIDSLVLASESELRSAMALGEKGKLLPLTSSQHTIFLDALVNPDAVQNATGYYLPINTALDVYILNQAIQHVTSQFGILRTTFHICDLPYADDGYQLVGDCLQIPFEIMPEFNGTKEALLTDIESWVYQPCDIFSDSLFKARLYQLGEKRYVFAVSGHHIVIDGVTYENHIRHIAASYNALKSEEPLPTWDDRFGEYILWEKAHIDSSSIRRFWKGTLKNVEPLTYTKPRSDNTSTNAVSGYTVQQERLTDKESAAIRDYCTQHHIHPSELFKLAVSYLVKLYCRVEEDFVLFEQQAGRRKGHFDTLGVYYQQLPVVIAKDAFHQTVAAFYHSQQQQKQEAKANRPFSMFAQRELVGQGNLFFQYNYYTFTAEIEIGDSKELLFIESPRPENAVQIIIKDEPEFLLELLFEPHLFSSDLFLKRMHQIVRSIVFSNVIDIRKLSALTREESQALAERSRKEVTKSDYANIIEWFEDAVFKSPQAIAAFYKNESISYQALNAYINKTANWLAANGVAKGDNVAISIGRSIEMIAAVWGCIKLGATYIPIDISYPKERIRYIVNDSNAKCLITETCLSQTFTGLHEKLLLLSQDSVEPFSDANLNIEIQANDLLYMIYTSGSTGAPKGAAVMHQGEMNLMSWYTGKGGSPSFTMGQSDRLLLISAFGFDLTQKNLFAPLLTGASLVIPETDQYDAKHFTQLIEQHQVTWVNCAPSAFYPLVEALSETTAERLASLRWLFLGGEPIQLNLLSDWLKHANNSCQLVNSYGPTECTDVVCYQVLEEFTSEQTVIPIGKPITNTQLYIVDKDLTLVPPGFIGELCVAGMGVGAGYLNRDDLNQEVFIANPFGEGRLYKTGDLARYLSDGSIEYIGRKDYQVKLRGLRIELGEIESALTELDFVTDSLALVNNEQIVGYVLADKAVLDLPWKDVLGDFLPDYMVPSYLVPLEKWPLTPNGKVDRKALPEPDSSQRNVEFVAPRNDQEELMARIWGDVLGVENVGVNDNFFDLGGHSVLATRLIARISKAFERTLQVRQIFEYPTIAELVQFVASGTKIEDALPVIKATNLSRDIPLTFGQQRIWFAEQVTNVGAANNMSTATLVSGELNLDAFRLAVESLVERHSCLRCTFYMNEDGQPLQQVAETLSSVFVLEENIQYCSTDAGIKQLVNNNKSKPFDLKNGPLIRINLVRLGDEKPTWLLLFAMHHIISDGQSINIMLKDLASFYISFATNKPLPLPPLPVQYTDYAVWQRDVIKGNALESQQAYWEDKLKNAPAITTIPADKQRGDVVSTNGDVFEFEINSEKLGKLDEFCADRKITPFTYLLMAWSLLLSRYAKQTDLCIGVPTTGRPAPELENVVGFFINSIILRLDASDNPTANQYLDSVNQALLEGMDNSFAPIETVIEKLNIPRHAGYSPLVQVAFQLVNTDQSSNGFNDNLTVADLSFSPLESDQHTSKFDITLTMSYGQGKLSGSIEYNTDLYKTETISNIAKHYDCVIGNLLESMGQPIDSLTLVDDSELINALNLDAGMYENVLPLTAMQYDMFLDNQVNPDSLQNSHGWNIHIHRTLDVELWKQCLQEFSDSQPILRSKYVPGTESHLEVGYLAVLNEKTINFSFVDLCEQPERLDDYVRNAIYHPYDLLNDELITFHVVKLAAEHFVVITAVHHAVLDGAALNSLWEQVTAAYEAKQRNESSIYEPANFHEFVLTDRQTMDVKSVREFWRNEFSVVEPLDFTLPSPIPQPAHFITKELFLDDGHWANIKKYCRKSRITPALFFKCLYGLMIKCYCRPDSGFSIQETMGGRTKGHFTQQGCYIQEIPFIFTAESLAAEKTFTELLQHARSFQKRIKDMRKISIGAQMALSPKGRIGFMFNFYQFLAHTEFLGEIFDPEGTPSDPASNVQFVVTEVGGRIKLNLFYHRHLFADFNMLGRIESLADQIVNQQKDLLAELLYVTEQRETNRLLNEWNDNKQDFDLSLCIHQHFEKQVKLTPDGTAIIDDQGTLTYQALNERANQLAHYLLSLGISNNDLVGLCADRSSEFLIGILATLKSGAAYVPMDPKYPQERITYMRDNSEVKILLTQSHLKQKVEGREGVTLFCLDTDWAIIQANSKENLELPISVRNRAYMIYTSGSTGKPKGAIIRHDGAMNHIEAEKLALEFDNEFSFLQTAPASSDISVWQFLGPVSCGGKVVVLDDVTHSKKMFELVKEHSIDVVELVPVALQLLMEHVRGLTFEQRQVPALKWMMATGEAVSVELVNDWLALYPDIPVVNAYGPTEAADDVIQCAIPEPLPANVKSVPIGKPLANLDVLILDELHRLVPTGVAGEICIGGIGVGEGYWNNVEKTQAAFIENPFSKTPGERIYKTGDLGRWLSDGTVEYLDRVDNQVKIRGFRIELGEIEAALHAQNGVREAIVIVRDDMPGGDALVGYLVPSAARKTDVVELRARLSEQLPSFMVPAALVILDVFPTTPAGKVDRKALPMPSLNMAKAPYVAPSTEKEKQLVDIWEEILKVDDIGIKDNFFDLGGHSLLGTQIVARVQKVLGITIALADLLQSPTVEALAASLNETAQVQSSAVKLKEGVAGDTLIYIHPIGGDVMCYRDLSEALSVPETQYGIRAPGYDDGKTVSSFSELVEHHIKQIKHIQPQGPYKLIAQSLGGVIALAIAEKLKARGCSVHSVVMLDTFEPKAMAQQAQTEVEMLEAAVGYKFPDSIHQLYKDKPKQWLRLAYDGAIAAGLLPSYFEFEQLNTIFNVAVTNHKLVGNYELGNIEVPVSHIRASDNVANSQEAWLKEGYSFNYHTTKGDHESMLRGERAHSLAEKLKQIYS